MLIADANIVTFFRFPNTKGAKKPLIFKQVFKWLISLVLDNRNKSNSVRFFDTFAKA